MWLILVFVNKKYEHCNDSLTIRFVMNICYLHQSFFCPTNIVVVDLDRNVKGPVHDQMLCQCVDSHLVICEKKLYVGSQV